MSTKQPVLFIAHGSPMNAIEKNSFTQKLSEISASLVPPKAILVISAHWLSEGTLLTSAAQPRMIYDMYGFPPALYQMKYPAPGDPNLVKEIQSLIADPQIESDGGKWGFDHGAWSILVHLFPQAQIPVLQMSIDFKQSFEFHFGLGRKLRALRDRGVLIIGSGNVVHNLGELSWNEDEPAYPWAQEFANWYTTKLLEKNYTALMQDYRKLKSGRMAVPTTEHYIPALYIMGAAAESETAVLEYVGIQNGSIAMTSFRFG